MGFTSIQSGLEVGFGFIAALVTLSALSLQISLVICCILPEGFSRCLLHPFFKFLSLFRYYLQLVSLAVKMGAGRVMFLLF